MTFSRLLAALLVAAVGCQGDEDVWVQFNGDGDLLEVRVGSDAIDDEGCDPGVSCTDLHSLVEGAVIGTATADPSSGPVGTGHRVLAIVGDEWEELVGRVSVEVESDRGIEEFDLQRDPANRGAWGLTLESLGSKGETRVDLWTVRLFESIPEDEVVETGGER